MPEGVALATTKRKLHRQLDILTSAQLSLSPASSEPVATAKRPATAAAAFDEARERAAKRLRHSTSSSCLPHKVVPSPTPSKKDGTKTKGAPNFSPWSHEAFLARLKTFSSVSLWHSKPEAISEVEWAKRGWVCVDVNTVACKGGCERRVVVSLDSPKKAVTEVEDGEDEGEDESAFEWAIAERYKDEIVDRHRENCLWRKQGCQDDIYRLQVVRPSVWQPELHKRYQSALAISSAIQDVKMKTLASDSPKLLEPARLLEELPADVLGFADLARDTAAAISALKVALHGWRGSTESGSELMHCDACFQRIGLWMYQPGYRPANLDADDEDTTDSAIIDLVDMHRDHCPWRNPTTQKASGSLKGLNACEILQRVVSTYSRDQRRRSDEQKAVENGHLEQQDVEATETVSNDVPVVSKEEVARQDKERESRIRKLKNLLTIKRRPKAGAK